MKVFMESEIFGYEEFEAVDTTEALLMVDRLRESALKQKDKVERKIGIIVNREED